MCSFCLWIFRAAAAALLSIVETVKFPTIRQPGKFRWIIQNKIETHLSPLNVCRAEQMFWFCVTIRINSVAGLFRAPHRASIFISFFRPRIRGRWKGFGALGEFKNLKIEDKFWLIKMNSFEIVYFFLFLSLFLSFLFFVSIGFNLRDLWHESWWPSWGWPVGREKNNLFGKSNFKIVSFFYLYSGIVEKDEFE